MKTCRSTLFLLALLGFSPLASAVWVVDRTAPYRVDGPIDIELRLGAFLYLQIGSTGSTVDTVGFDLTNENVGDGVPIDAITPDITVIVRSNHGAITLGALSDGTQGLVNDTGGSLSYSQILTTTSNPGLPAPTLVDGTSGTVNIVANQFNGFVTEQRALWKYQLANSVIAPAGTYGGGVTYTASTP